MRDPTTSGTGNAALRAAPAVAAGLVGSVAAGVPIGAAAATALLLPAAAIDIRERRLPDNPQVRGMISKVSHLVVVEADDARS